MGGAQVPGADPGAGKPVETTAPGAEIAAGFRHGANGLGRRRGLFCEVKKNQIPKIEPDLGPEATGIGAAAACNGTKPAEGRVDANQAFFQVPGQADRPRKRLPATVRQHREAPVDPPPPALSGPGRRRRPAIFSSDAVRTVGAGGQSPPFPRIDRIQSHNPPFPGPISPE